jgi:hypothetical protein
MPSLGLVKAAIKMFPGFGGSIEVNPVGLVFALPLELLLDALFEMFGFGLGLGLLLLLLLLLLEVLSPLPFAAPLVPFLCFRYFTFITKKIKNVRQHAPNIFH